jgi:hypothetical protein
MTAATDSNNGAALVRPRPIATNAAPQRQRGTDRNRDCHRKRPDHRQAAMATGRPRDSMARLSQ